MATDFDPYRILGVDSRSSADDVWDAYSRLIGEFGMGTARRTEIEAAYAVIGRPEQRKEYDARAAHRETAGVSVSPPDAVAEALAPHATTAISYASVPWTLGDLAKALILPLLLIALNIGSAALSSVDEEDLTESDYIVSFAFGLVLEAALFLLAYHFAVRKYKLSMRSLGFTWPRDLRWWFPLAIFGAAILAMWIYVAVLMAFGAEPSGNLPDNAYDYAVPVVMLGFLTILVAPVVEEVYFRAFLFQGFARRFGSTVGISASACIFGLAHVADLETLAIVPPIIIIGAIFAWAFRRSGSIYPSLIAHVLFNTISFGLGFTQ
jgi:membrane protease YdiL (CAAX protease family)